MRVLLVLLVAAALGGIGFEVRRLERNRSAARAEGRDFGQKLHAIRLAVRDLQAAEQACVAHGQGEQFWIGRVDTLTRSIEESLGVARQAATAPPAAQALEAAQSSLTDFRALDSRARQYVLGGQHLLASDIIFADALESTASLDRCLQEAASAEALSRDAEDARLQRVQMYLLGGAGGAVFLIAVLLIGALGGTSSAADDSSKAAAGAPDTETSSARRLGLRDLQALERIISQPEPVTPRPATSPAAGDEGPASHAIRRGHPETRTPPPAAAEQVSATDSDGRHRDSAAAAPPSPASEAAATPNLGEAARLCADLARVAEAQELPGLLGRAASLLGASGVVVWVQNPAGTALIPALGHGYTPHVMARMQPIARDADNSVADAYRAGEMRVVAAKKDDSKGAIVTPLVTPSGPVGVLSAEVPAGLETSKAVQALATIIGAQLATLIPGPPPPAV
ncbi:MAG: hypothetical protein ACE148_17565 [Vicinamibacterales bacterium]